MSGGLRHNYASARAGLRLCRVVAFLALLAGAAVAAAGEETREASTSSAARQDAARAIPLAKIDPNYRRQVSEVLGDPSLFRRLPTNVVDCQPGVVYILRAESRGADRNLA